MTSNEWYRVTFQEVKPSKEAVQKILSPNIKSQTRGKNRLKWAVVLVMLFAGALGCGYAVKAHIITIRTDDYSYFEELEQYEQVARELPEDEIFQIGLPKELGCGFVFVNCTVMDQSVTDAEGNKQKRELLSATYAVSGNMAYYEYWGQSEIHLSVGELFPYQQESMETTKPTDRTEIGDIEVRYLECKQFVVAPDYELTETDLEQIEGENVMIVTGLKAGEKPQLRNSTTCYWTMDNQFYELTQYDSRLSVEEWYYIAQIIIDARQEKK